MKQIHDGLSQLFLESLGDYQLIHATEDCIIRPGETKELKTDISKIKVCSTEENKALEFTNEGIISSFGFLAFSFDKDYENGNKIFVKNNVPKKVYEEYDLCGYHYCNPETTQYFGPGVYRIKAGTEIGVAGIDRLALDFPKQYGTEKEEQSTASTKELVKKELF